MARKRTDIDRDDLIAKHRAGATASDLAGEHGVTHKVITRILGDAYMTRAQLVRTFSDEVVAAYVAGESAKSIADRMPFDRNSINILLREAGVERRGRSEAELLKWSQMDSDARRQQVRNAHRAARGRKRSHAELCKGALARQKNPGEFISDIERELTTMLEQRCLTGRPQLAIGPYNADIAIDPVAVEVWGGHWHFSGRHAARTPRRFRYMLNAGWHVLAVVVATNSPLTPAVADYVATYIERARSNPSARREYRVVWRAGEFTTAGCADDHKITIEPPFTSRRDPATGQYQTIAR